MTSVISAQRSRGGGGAAAPGWVWLAAWNSCAHQGPLPVDQLIRKHGELALVEVVLVGLRCTECRSYGASVLILKLCEPGCPRQR